MSNRDVVHTFIIQADKISIKKLNLTSFTYQLVTLTVCIHQSVIVCNSREILLGKLNRHSSPFLPHPNGLAH